MFECVFTYNMIVEFAICSLKWTLPSNYFSTLSSRQRGVVELDPNRQSTKHLFFCDEYRRIVMDGILKSTPRLLIHEHGMALSTILVCINRKYLIIMYISTYLIKNVIVTNCLLLLLIMIMTIIYR